MNVAAHSSLYATHLKIMMQQADLALAKTGFEHLLISSGTTYYHAFDDIAYPYAVNPYFKTWLPLTDAPESWLVYTPGKRPQLMYYQPEDYWHAAPITPVGDWVEHFTIHLIRQPEQVLALLPKSIEKCAIIGETQSALGGYIPNNPETIIHYLDWQRSIKTEYELALMHQAQILAVRGHQAAQAAFYAGDSEFAIHMAYCRAVGQDAYELPYPNIVALNEHAAILHYDKRNQHSPSKRYSFLLDAGASVKGYASDITRTYAASEHNDFQSLINAVEGVQQTLCHNVQVGLDYRELHLKAHLLLAQVLRDFNIITVCAQTALETGVSSVFFPHGLGHLLGAQVHDVGGFLASQNGGKIEPPKGHPYLRLTRTLQPGMVVTIEPGIYFIDLLLEKAKQTHMATSINWKNVDFFRPYGGIRIEDNVVCTNSTPKNLTRNAFSI